MSTPTTKSWRLLPHDRAAVERLAASLRLSPVVAQLLLNRGIETTDAARRFLDVPLSGLHPPELLPGVPEAADRIFAAVEAGKRICVYGDYDVDGISGTAILLQCLRLLGAQVEFYVPNRLDEGYGLNFEALRQLAADGVALVVTVDCGIASFAEAAAAKQLGLELIVTDHHEYKATLPDAVLVHPRLPGTSYPFGWLSGSAVAFKLAWALAQRASGGPKVTPRFRDFLLDAVALASLGVVGDVVPLLDENRILVRHGLWRLQQAPLPGVKALCEFAGIEAGQALRATDIGFRLGSRLNAAGRLGCARLVVDLLTATQRQQAVDLARVLDGQNGQRQTLERRMLAEARELAERTGALDEPAIVLASTNWHSGVMGIVASRLVDQYGRPALMMALPPSTDGEAVVYVGSGRSIPGFPLSQALTACSDLLLTHGGHAMAAGFRVRSEDLDAFRERFCAQVAAHFPAGPPQPSLTLDAETPLSLLTIGLVQDLDRLEPYGADNRKPIFLAGGLQVVGDPKRVGTPDNHLSFRVRQHDMTLKAIAFGMADRLGELLSQSGACCLAFTPRINEWQGRKSIDLQVVDFQPGAQARLE